MTRAASMEERPVVRKLASSSGLACAIAEHLAAASAPIPFPIRHGDLLCAEGECVAKSSFGELVFDLYYGPKPLLVRALWGLRGAVGRWLGWELHPRDGRFPNQWRSPAQPLTAGQKVGFMRLVRAGDDALTLRIENRTVEAYFLVQREGARLYMGSVVQPKGRSGEIYWRFIKPFHELVIRGWLAGSGRTFQQRRRAEEPSHAHG